MLCFTLLLYTHYNNKNIKSPREKFIAKIINPPHKMICMPRIHTRLDLGYEITVENWIGYMAHHVQMTVAKTCLGRDWIFWCMNTVLMFEFNIWPTYAISSGGMSISKSILIYLSVNNLIKSYKIKYLELDAVFQRHFAGGGIEQKCHEMNKVNSTHKLEKIPGKNPVRSSPKTTKSRFFFIMVFWPAKRAHPTWQRSFLHNRYVHIQLSSYIVIYNSYKNLWYRIQQTCCIHHHFDAQICLSRHQR